MDEAGQLRQLIGAVLIERGEPLVLHLSSLHMARAARFRIRHLLDDACMEVSLEEEQTDAPATRRTNEEAAGGSTDPGPDEQT